MLKGSPGLLTTTLPSMESIAAVVALEHEGVRCRGCPGQRDVPCTVPAGNAVRGVRRKADSAHSDTRQLPVEAKLIASRMLVTPSRTQDMPQTQSQGFPRPHRDTAALTEVRQETVIAQRRGVKPQVVHMSSARSVRVRSGHLDVKHKDATQTSDMEVFCPPLGVELDQAGGRAEDRTGEAHRELGQLPRQPEQRPEKPPEPGSGA